MSHSKISLVIDSALENVSLVGVAVHRLAQHAGCTEGVCGEVELAVVEAVTNSVRHAYRGDPNNRIEVDLRLSNERLEIRVIDQGDPPPEGMFDPEKVELPDGTVEGGRGCFLIVALMDEVESKREGTGNVLRMVRRR